MNILVYQSLTIRSRRNSFVHDGCRSRKDMTRASYSKSSPMWLNHSQSTCHGFVIDILSHLTPGSVMRVLTFTRVTSKTSATKFLPVQIKRIGTASFSL